MNLIGPLLLINGPDMVIVYWAPDGSCDYILYRLGFG